MIAKALSLLALAATLLLPTTVQASDEQLPSYLRDRGTGIATSLFGTYVRKGELLVYPFYEYTRNEDQEYSPNELGYGIDTDYRAKAFSYCRCCAGGALTITGPSGETGMTVSPSLTQCARVNAPANSHTSIGTPASCRRLLHFRLLS